MIRLLIEKEKPMCIGSRPKIPPPPAPPTPVETPKAAGDDTQRAGNRTRDRLLAMAGRQSTILTQSGGSANTAQRSLLGG